MISSELEYISPSLKLLRNQLRKGRVVNAYIFQGPDQMGSKRAALYLAKALNCLQARNGDYCGSCLSCRKIENFTHPDVLWIKPQGLSSRIGIEKIREIKEKDSFKPLQGKWRVFIIENAHRMTLEAAHSLLKILEEPSPQTTIILLVPSLSGVLPTIISRSQILNFPPPPLEVSLKRVMDTTGWSREKAIFFCRVTGGREELISLWEEAQIWKLREKITHYLSKIPSSELSFPLLFSQEILKVIQGYRKSLLQESSREKNQWSKELGKEKARIMEEEWKSRREEKVRFLIHQVLHLIYAWYRDLLIMKKGGRDIVNMDKKEEILKKISYFSPEYILKSLEKIEEVERAIESNANLSLALQVLSNQLFLIDRGSL